MIHKRQNKHTGSKRKTKQNVLEKDNCSICKNRTVHLTHLTDFLHIKITHAHKENKPSAEIVRQVHPKGKKWLINIKATQQSHVTEALEINT